jgi:hypothetical protein
MNEELEEPFEVVVKDHTYLITPLENETFDISVGTNRLGNIQHNIEHDNGPCWETSETILEEDVEAIGNAIEFKYC